MPSSDEVTEGGGRFPVIVYRQLLFDLCQDGRGIAEAIGLPRISDEVAEMEARDSAERQRRMLRFHDAVHDMTGFLGTMFVSAQRAAAENNGVPFHPAAWELMREQITSMLESSATGVLGILVDMGALHVDPDWAMPPAVTEETT